MNSNANWGIVALASALVLSGVPLMVASDRTGAIVAGAVISGSGSVMVVVYIVVALFMRERGRVTASATSALDVIQQSTDGIITNFEEGVAQLNKVVERMGILNDARFVPEGFIGLQEQCLVLDSDLRTGARHVRMAVHGHLPSHVRTARLTEARGAGLYDNWEPPHLVTRYVELVNLRYESLKKFLDDGGVVREIYDKDKIAQYAKQGFTIYDKIIDPVEEIRERINALLALVQRPNYYVSLLGQEHDERPSQYFLLKQDVGLVIDLRTNQTRKHFTKSIDGLYTNSATAMAGYEEKFQLMWNGTEKSVATAFLENLIKESHA